MKSPDERGSAGGLMLIGMLSAIAMAFWIAAVLISWFSAIRVAEQAAELSAVAGATASVRGDDPCAAARQAASRNGAKLESCAIRGSGRHVVVEICVVAELNPAPIGAPREVVRTSAAGTF